jgi:catechol 2,3-dioxygenase-like lactoylglutathione lyase family enzyme
MLTKSTITTLLPVTNRKRAGHFYADTLGLRPTGAGPDGTLYFEAGAGIIGLRTAEAGTQSLGTALSFEVDDLETEMLALQYMGVKFQDFDADGLTTVNHIADFGAERAAWFVDTEGNTLCLHQTV